MEVEVAIHKTAIMMARYEKEAREWDNISPPHPQAIFNARKYREEAEALRTLINIAKAFSREGRE